MITTAAIVLAHGCAGACWSILLLRAHATSQGRSPDAWLQRATRVLLVVSSGLGVPALASALLRFVSIHDAVAASVRQAVGPILGVLLACPVVFVVAWAASIFASRTRAARALELAAALASLLGVIGGACVASFFLHPGPWVEIRSLSALLLTPWVFVQALLHIGWAMCLGGLALLIASPARSSRGAGESVDRLGGWTSNCALGCTAIAVLAVAWIAQGRIYDPWLGVVGATGVHAGRAVRMVTVAIGASVALNLALGLHARARWKYLSAADVVMLLAVAVIAASAWLQARSTAVRPWAIPGRVYANGTSLETVRTRRRSPVLDTTLRHSSEWIGTEMFGRQCRTCHEASGAFRAALQDRGFPETRALLERLRDADQYAAQYRDVMPPLVGSDPEVDALARWLCGQP